MRPLHVAFVWHMHQPYYKDDLTSTYLLPWVRLRCCKDYHKMAALLDGYPGVRQTFNLVPSLLAQIEDYAEGGSEDLFLNLSRRPAADLEPDERAFILRWMRESPRFLRVQASQRYLELASRSEADSFSVDDLRDLQVWFNLAWCDPAWVDSDPALTALKAKDQGFSEADKEAVFSAQLDMMRRVIPKYKDLAARGQVELTFSPYYHPILPLLCHVESARTAQPHLPLPERRFTHREDALRQIELGIGAFERLLGVRPRGMWPSEMAVGETVAGLATEAGVGWFISDEEILARSLGMSLTRDHEGRLHQPDLLYTPYSIDRDGGRVQAVFRDALLSNLIGFDYHRMHALDAARDLIRRLRMIREQQGDRNFLVTIALDGENAWEFFARDGHDFLNALYSELETADDIITTTPGDFIAEHGESRPLSWLHTGSWIGACLDTWIGDPEHNVAWNLLSEARDWLEDFAAHHPGAKEQVAAAWREIVITEGSDWFWWFANKHDSGMDTFWDGQFRLHLRNVYKLVGAKPPARLFRPILEPRGVVESRRPTVNITPQSRADAAWEKAGRFDVGSGFGALHKPVGMIERVLYGHDESHLHLRLDSPFSASELAAGEVVFWVFVSGAPALPEGDQAQLTVPIQPATLEELDFEPGHVVRIGYEPGQTVVTVATLAEDGARAYEVARMVADDAFFLSLPFEALGKMGGEPMQLGVVVERAGQEVEQIPPTGSLGLRVPNQPQVAVVDGGRRLQVLIASPEVAPFAKARVLADICAELAKELGRQGHDVRLVMPRYHNISIEGHGLSHVAGPLSVPLASVPVEFNVFEGRLGEVPVYLVDCPRFFDREGIYGFGDEDARFIFFSRAVIEMLRPVGFIPDVIHTNDWPTALISNLLERLYARDAELSSIATVFTIHNLGFQGTFGSGTLHLAGLDEWGLLQVGIPHLDDVVNILGRGIHYADAFTTESERYAEEIQTPELGEGLDQFIQANSHKLYGIVNGIDCDRFDPEHDPALPCPYSAADPSGKAASKATLRAELGLAEGDSPLVVMISRLYEQKGLDLVEKALPMLLDLDIQFAVLGAGDRHYEDLFRSLAAQNPDRVAASIGFEGSLAQLFYAGADMFLMPSQFEPCGIGQLISLRYGTIPIVRATGGLVDTIRNVDLRSNTGFGFSFEPYDPFHLVMAALRATENYGHRAFWRELVQRAMSQNVSWAHSARRYVQVYRAAIASHRDRRGRSTTPVVRAG